MGEAIRSRMSPTSSKTRTSSKSGTTFTSGERVPVISAALYSEMKERCLATPCHTQDSICYYVTDPTDMSHPGGLFTGDTLFIGGCGRFFEGTADEMIHALKYLGSLPDKTIVYNGHEYTASNLAFGRFIEPNSSGIARLSEIVKNNDITTGKTTVGEEKEWNVFMRLNAPTVRQVSLKTPILLHL